MKNLLRMNRSRVIAIAILITTCSLAAFAQSGTPSSKATAAINTAVGCTVSSQTTIGDVLPQSCHDIFSGAAVDVTPDNFARIMKSTVKLSNSQSLFVTPSLVTGLYTSTKTKSSPAGGASTAVAQGGVYLRAVLYDSNENAILAEPIKRCDNSILGCYADANGAKGVVLDSRVQTLSQDISACIVNVNTGGVPGTGTCTFDLTTQLILQTTSAHTFGFIFPNVGQGVYRLEIQVAVNSGATVSGSGTAIGSAAYGLGSVTAESVRLVHDFTF
jgi:hypothetical protein